jgi:glycerate-2-kinase
MLDALSHLDGVHIGDVVVAEGAHPVPDAASVEAGERAMRLAAQSRASRGLLVVLLSGGASAMMALPAEGIPLTDKAELTRLLLAGGLSIDQMNAVRKHVSAIKGGQLGASAGRSITFAISDVHTPVPDDPATIGSGPTVADPSTFDDARAVLQGAGFWGAAPASIRARLQESVEGRLAETVKPGDPRLRDAQFVLAGGRGDAMRGAAERARQPGYHVMIAEPPILGAAWHAAQDFTRFAAAARMATSGPLCVIASGETTVTLAPGSSGRGGRNQEFALAAAPLLSALPDCVLISVGTDGVDGPTNAAGAFADSTTFERGRQQGLNHRVALEAHASHDYFGALGDLLVTGPTGTNVGDLQVVLFA